MTRPLPNSQLSALAGLLENSYRRKDGSIFTG